jgi:2',3'-cyclic-nucleotide 2'-phosphodiesterase (5'-nucleotidase family)
MPRLWCWLGFGIIGLSAVVAGYLLLRGAAADGLAQELDGSKEQAPPMFVGWNKPPPDLAIVVSGEMHGYLQPCGCSKPQKGGLARRYNFIESLKKKWPVAAVDLGDIAQSSGPQQQLKYYVAMKSLKLMGYQAVGIGKNEFLMPLTTALGSYSINEPEPRPVAANLIKTNANELFHALNVRKGDLFRAGPFKVGVVGAIGANTAGMVKQSLPPTEVDIKFLDHQKILPQVLQVLGGQKTDIGILLFQGDEKEAAQEAVFLHKAHVANPAVAPVQIIVCLSDDEPPAFPKKVAGAPDTSIITVGHKGRYVGVVGLWKTAKGLEMKYQLVPIGPEYQTRPGQEKNNPVIDLIQKNAEEIRDGNYLARFPRDNHDVQTVLKNARYEGSEVCIK